MHRLSTALLTLAAVTAGLVMLAAPAFAGSYTVSACSPFSTPGAWTQTNTAGAGLTAGQLCGGPLIGPPQTLGSPPADQGALYAEDNVNSPATIPGGAQAGWIFTAPAGTTITAISYYRALATYKEPDLVAGLFQASGAPLEQCMTPNAFGSPSVCSMPNTQAPVMFSSLSTTSLFFGVACHIIDPPVTACNPGGTAHYAQADLYSAKVTLTQNALPTIAQAAGPLWGGGFVAGTVPVTFAATDPSGIQQDLVRSDTGQTLIAAVQACDYTTAQPCPQLPSGSLSVDTTRVADGPHTFVLAVTDAAGNGQTATSPPVVVDNNGPPPASPFTATALGGGSHVIDLSWRNPPDAPAAVTAAMVELCQATCGAPMSVSPSGTAQITAPGPGLYSLRLWLTDAQGHGGQQNAALASVTVPGPGVPTHPGPAVQPPPANTSTARTHVVATIHGNRLRVSGTIAATIHGSLLVTWRSRASGHTLGRGSRMIAIRSHRILLGFNLSRRDLTGAIHVLVRSGRQIIANARAARSKRGRCAPGAPPPPAALAYLGC